MINVSYDIADGINTSYLQNFKILSLVPISQFGNANLLPELLESKLDPLLKMCFLFFSTFFMHFEFVFDKQTICLYRASVLHFYS